MFLGLLNLLDPLSVEQNTEIGVILDADEIAQGMGEWFDENIEEVAFRLQLETNADGQEAIVWHGIVDGQNKTYLSDPFTGFWRRFGVGFLGLLPIESQL